MRTSVVIDPDVEVLLQTAVREQQKSLDEVLNETLRQSLARDARIRQKPYRVQSRPLGIRTEVDLNGALRLSDALEDAEIIRKLREGR
ncbi:MAG TPA: hypothetical protein PLF81_15400 [Candidatus Anammoximicrobium sp.]|nr:hypothetical protein [Candidatus Anammoximicrobium sp.]